MQSGNFQSPEANRKFGIWINNHPASEHDLDYVRFADMVLAILDAGEALELEHIKQHQILHEDLIDRLMNRYYSMRDMYSILLDCGRINHGPDTVG